MKMSVTGSPCVPAASATRTRYSRSSRRPIMEAVSPSSNLSRQKFRNSDRVRKAGEAAYCTEGG